LADWQPKAAPGSGERRGCWQLLKCLDYRRDDQHDGGDHLQQRRRPAWRGGRALGRTISVHDFGGTQTVTSGTLTLTMPTADQTNGLLRIS
jgi:hypothetical protein